MTATGEAGADQAGADQAGAGAAGILQARATDLAAHERVLEQALAWAKGGRGAALATVVSTWGSAPRQPGAQLAISGEAELSGSVSGGCVEAAVAAEALEAIADGAPRLLEYGVSDDDAFAVGLACGGVIRVMVDPLVADGAGRKGLPMADAARLAAARAGREAIGYAVALDGWARRFVAPSEAAEAFRADRSGVIEEGGAAEMLTVHNPPLGLVVVGAAHIAQALTPMATLLGYDVTVIDPRGAFATEQRFPGLVAGDTLHDAWPADLLADPRSSGVRLDPRTALVCFTHDPKIDDPALQIALRSDAFYVGALGSTRTHAKRVDRLRTAGLSDAEIGRLSAPIGLDIGAKSPAEIALSVLAEMTERLRRPPSAQAAA